MELRPDGWEAVGVSFDSGPNQIRDYVVDYFDPEKLLVTNGQTIVRSSDGGCSWREVIALTSLPSSDPQHAKEINTIDALVISESDSSPGIVYALLNGAAGPHVLTSSDHGTTWRWADSGLLPIGTAVRLAVAPSDPRIAYLSVRVDTIPAVTRTVLYSTRDGGGQWTRVYPNDPVNEGELGDPIRINPLDPSNLVSISQPRSLVVSNDGGVSWTEVSRFDEQVGNLTDIQVYREDLLIVFSDRPESYWSWNGGISYLRRPIPALVESAAIGATQREVAVATHDQGCQVAVNQAESQSWICIRSSEPEVQDVSLTRVDPQIYAYSNIDGPMLERYRTDLLRGQTISPETSDLEWFSTPGCGLATLIDRKRRVLGSPNLTPRERHIYLNPGESAKAQYTLDLPPIPTPLDVDLLMDTTGSMGPTICRLRQSLQVLINELARMGIDVHFGVGQYKDYPIGQFGWPTDFPYRREHKVGPPGPELVLAMSRLIEGGGLDGPEAQLPALYQSATGAGQLPYIPPDMDAGFRDDALRVIVHMTDSTFHDESHYPGPSFRETARVLNREEIKQVGIAASSGGRGDLEGMAAATDAIVPEGGLDCDDNGTVDLLAGAPLVCSVDDDRLTRMSSAVLGLLKAIKDLGDVDLSVVRNASMIEGMSPARYPSVNLRNEHSLDFEVTFTCDIRDAGSIRAVPLVATVKGKIVSRAVAQVHCAPLPSVPSTTSEIETHLVPGLVPPIPVPPQPPVAAGAPAVEQVPAPMQNPVSQSQGVGVAQRQEQPQPAFVRAATRVREQLAMENSMVRLRNEREPFEAIKSGLAMSALALVLVYGALSISVRRVRSQRVFNKR